MANPIMMAEETDNFRLNGAVQDNAEESRSCWKQCMKEPVLDHPCWSNGFCCCCSICLCLTSPKSQFVSYVILNVFRLAVVALLIYIATVDFQNDDKALRADCCNCYQLAKSSTADQLDSYDRNHDRFDLSMCIPNCADCTYCDQQIGPVYSQLTCPATDPDYTPDKQWVHSDWYKHTGCKAHKHRISLTEFFFFSKSYKTYRILSTAIICSYIALLLIFLLLLCPNIAKCCGISAGLETELSRAVLFFNALLSPVCLYFILKPYEYHAEPFTIYGEAVTCSRVAITVSTRHAMVAMLVGLLIFVLLYAVMEVVNCCRCCRMNPDCCACCPCCAKQRGHVDETVNEQLLADDQASSVEQSVHYKWNKMKTWFGTAFCLWIFAFFVVLICSIGEMTYSIHRFGDLHAMHARRQLILYSSAVLSISLLLDFLLVSTPRQLLRDYCKDAKHCCKRNRVQPQRQAVALPLNVRDDHDE